MEICNLHVCLEYHLVARRTAEQPISEQIECTHGSEEIECVAQFVPLGSIGSAGRVVLLCQCVISLPPPVSLPPRHMPTTPIPTIGPPTHITP